MPIRPFSLPPNPSLVAVVVVIRTRSGPRVVFHYPPTPEATQHSTSWHFGSAGSDSESSGTSSDEDQTVASDDESTTSSRLTARPSVSHSRTGKPSESSSSRRTARTLREDAPDNDEEDVDVDHLDLDVLDLNSPIADKPSSTAAIAAGNAAHDRPGNASRTGASDTNKSTICEWDKVLGYPAEGLEMMLSPPSSMHKKRFEVMLDDLVFLGYPIFVREDGSWKKKKKKGNKPANDNRQQDEDSGSDDQEDKDHDGFGSDDEEPGDDNVSSPPVSPLTPRIPRSKHGFSHAHSYETQSAHSEATSEADSANSNQDEMTMFHVVFVMNPPALEYHIRLQEMYDNVVKKFSKALRYEQARSGAVWQDVKKIQSLKAQAKESKTPMSILWPNIISSCLVAKSIAILYTSIANSKIAHVSIGPDFDASIQIPQAVSTPYVPTPTEPQLPGLWLTTASTISDDGQSLSPHSALLLLEDKDTILKEIEGDGKELASPLTFFIRELTPTKSLVKLSAALSLPLSDVQFLARHLIYWRRARAIPPLHIRDTYIVSPNCDMRRLDKAMPIFAQHFSALPSLPKMLQNLSGKPIQYGYLIPSKDHKPAYMDILAWLLRGGWVTQLRTFAWIKVSPEVKSAAAVRLYQEYHEKMAKRPPAALKNKGSVSSEDTGRRSVDHESNSDFGPSRNPSVASPRPSGLLSPSGAASDAGSVGSGRTAIPPFGSRTQSPNIGSSRLGTVDKPPSSPPSMLSTGSATEHDEAETVMSMPPLPPLEATAYEQTLVLSPHKASTEESRWLAYIGSTLQDAELKDHWGILHKHFDGKRALEEIASREGMKRSKVQGLLSKLEQEGVLYIVRHW